MKIQVYDVNDLQIKTITIVDNQGIIIETDTLTLEIEEMKDGSVQISAKGYLAVAPRFRNVVTLKPDII